MNPAVYIIASETGLVKVGASTWRSRRIRLVYSPDRSNRAAICYTDRHPLAYRIEHHAHRLLEPWRYEPESYREWFTAPIPLARDAIVTAWREIAGGDCVLYDACRQCRGFGCENCEG